MTRVSLDVPALVGEEHTTRAVCVGLNNTNVKSKFSFAKLDSLPACWQEPNAGVARDCGRPAYLPLDFRSGRIKILVIFLLKLM